MGTLTIFFYGAMEFVNKIKGDKVKFSRIKGTCNLLTPDGPFSSYYRWQKPLIFVYFISIYLKHKNSPSHFLTSQNYSTQTYDIRYLYLKLQCSSSVISGHVNNINAKVAAKEGACLESTFMDSQQVSLLLPLPWEVLCCPLKTIKQLWLTSTLYNKYISMLLLKAQLMSKCVVPKKNSPNRRDWNFLGVEAL